MMLTDEEMVLYADGDLSAERYQEIVEAAAHDPELAEILAALDASRLPFQTAFASKDEPAMPDHLRNTLQQLVDDTVAQDASPDASPDATLEPQAIARPASQSDTPQQQWPTRFLQAACVLLSLGVGYVVGTGGISLKAPPAEVASASSWVSRVADYQSLYVPNTVRNISVDRAASEEKLQRLAATSNLKTAIPDLSAEGYAFVRAQELGFEGQPLVQLVYYSEGRPPLALCFMASDATTESDLQLQTFHGLGTASWVADNQRFVIVAEESPDTLKDLYRNVIDQFKAT